jgi:hypothetical protein
MKLVVFMLVQADIMLLTPLLVYLVLQELLDLVTQLLVLLAQVVKSLLVEALAQIALVVLIPVIIKLLVFNVLEVTSQKQQVLLVNFVQPMLIQTMELVNVTLVVLELK